ncbi:hypothetical protein HZS_2992 [Henneguya salminicola]|nr:hypothetical protein HZS_2992 [Henneguya salminicola]
MKWKRILTIISGSEELSPHHSSFMSISHSQSNDLHALVTKLQLKPKKERLFNEKFSVKARALIFAHLSRHNDRDKFLVNILPLLSEFQQITSAIIYHKMSNASIF